MIRCQTATITRNTQAETLSRQRYCTIVDWTCCFFFMKLTPWKTTHTAMSMLYPTPVQCQVYLFPCSSTLPEEEVLNKCPLFNDTIICSVESIMALNSNLRGNWKDFGRKGHSCKFYASNCIKGLRKTTSSQSKEYDLALPEYKDKRLPRESFSSVRRQIFWSPLLRSVRNGNSDLIFYYSEVH